MHTQTVILQQSKLFSNVVGIILSWKCLRLGVYRSIDHNEFLACKCSASAEGNCLAAHVLDVITFICEQIHPFKTREILLARRQENQKGSTPAAQAGLSPPRCRGARTGRYRPASLKAGPEPSTQGPPPPRLHTAPPPITTPGAEKPILESRGLPGGLRPSTPGRRDIPTTPTPESAGLGGPPVRAQPRQRSQGPRA